MTRNWITACMTIVAFGSGLSIGGIRSLTADTSPRVLEIRTYTTMDGKLDALVGRLRTARTIFEKHGMKSVLYTVAADAPQSQNTLVYVLSHESRGAATKAWASVLEDPEFKSLIEATGRVTTNVQSMFVNPTDYSSVR